MQIGKTNRMLRNTFKKNRQHHITVSERKLLHIVEADKGTITIVLNRDYIAAKEQMLRMVHMKR